MINLVNSVLRIHLTRVSVCYNTWLCFSRCNNNVCSTVCPDEKENEKGNEQVLKLSFLCAVIHSFNLHFTSNATPKMAQVAMKLITYE